MPRTLVRAPGTDRNRSLGWLSNAWMEFFVRHGRGGVIGQPIRHGDEMLGFVVDVYALDENGRSPYDSVFFSRPKVGGRRASVRRPPAQVRAVTRVA